MRSRIQHPTAEPRRALRHLLGPVGRRATFLVVLLLVLLSGCVAPVEEVGSTGTDRVSDDPPSIVVEGRFAGFEMGDYAHVHLRRTLGPDCSFWGVGDTDRSLVDALETDAEWIGRDLIVGFAQRHRFIPEADAELFLAETERLVVPDAAEGTSADQEIVIDLDASRRAAEAFVTDVTGLDMPLRIEDVGIHGDQAVAVAIYGEHPMPDWSHGWVLLERDGGVWRGLDYGSGLQPPTWYRCGAEPPPALATGVAAWAGTLVWEEASVRRAGGVYATVVWTLEIEPDGRGRLTVDGLQAAETYEVTIAGDDVEMAILLRDAVLPRVGADLEPGATLVTLFRHGSRVLTRLERLEPRLEATGDVWAVRFRRQ